MPLKIRTLQSPPRARDKIEDLYEVIDVKRGGFGIVYISRDLKFGTGIAIKTFQDRFFTNREVMSAFNHEAEVWVKIGVHDNIVAAHYVTYVDEKPHIFMEYVDGGKARALDRAELRPCWTKCWDLQDICPVRA